MRVGFDRTGASDLRERLTAQQPAQRSVRAQVVAATQEPVPVDFVPHAVVGEGQGVANLGVVGVALQGPRQWQNRVVRLTTQQGHQSAVEMQLRGVVPQRFRLVEQERSSLEVAFQEDCREGIVEPLLSPHVPQFCRQRDHADDQPQDDRRGQGVIAMAADKPRGA